MRCSRRRVQALVHRDALVAKLTFTQLYTSIRRERLDNDPEAMGRLHGGVARLLETQDGVLPPPRWVL